MLFRSDPATGKVTTTLDDLAAATFSGESLAPQSLSQSVQDRLANLPAGARIITFEAPLFEILLSDKFDALFTSVSPGAWGAKFDEQFFDFGSRDNVYWASYVHFVDNTTMLFSQLGDIDISHKEGLNFYFYEFDTYHHDFYTLNLEPTGNYIGDIEVIGTLENGTTITQTFEVYDTWVQETCVLGDEFRNNPVTSIHINTIDLVGYDNFAFKVIGQETPPVLPPELPTLYHVTWDAPKHKLGEFPSVGGAYAPSSITDCASGCGYLVVATIESAELNPFYQISYHDMMTLNFELNRGATDYSISYDTIINDMGIPTAQYPNTQWFDSLLKVNLSDGNSVTYTARLTRSNMMSNSLDIEITKTIRSASNSLVSQNTLYTKSNVFTLGVLHHFKANIDRVGKTIEFVLDNNLLFSEIDTNNWDDLSAFSLNYLIGQGYFNESPPVAIAYPNGKLDNIIITGDGILPAVSFRVLPQGGLHFGAVDFGVGRSKRLRVRNDGSGDFSITNLVSDRAEFTFDLALPAVVAAGEVVEFDVTYMPTSELVQEGTLTVYLNNEATPADVVALSGKGKNAPSITVAPSSLRVQMLANSFGTETFTVGSWGGSDLVFGVTDALVGGEDDYAGPVSVNDVNFGQLWGMDGVIGVNAEAAWGYGIGASASPVALLDTGVDRAHPDLAANIWVNPGEIANNGVDDDGNGLVDDVSGWDFANDDNDPADGNGHGTHVAGTLAAVGNNGAGVVGVAWGAKLLPIKFLSDGGSGYTSDAIEAIDYGVQMGARVSNNSWGGGGESQALIDAIERANAAGQVFCAAAGNDGRDSDINGHLPSSYPSTNIISVAALDQDDELAFFSNYGQTRVDLGAPGSNILSTLPVDRYGYYSGTSMAAPHVAGVAALVLGRNPTLGVGDVKALILGNVNVTPGLDGRCATGGRLDAYRTLSATLPEWVIATTSGGTLPPGSSMVVPLALDTTGMALGTYQRSFVVRSNDPARPEVVVPITLEVVGDSPYQQWVASNFADQGMLFLASETSQWGDRADADGDGKNTLMEYFFGTNPTVSERDASYWLERSGDASAYRFVFDRRADLNGLNYEVRWSTDLKNWRTDALERLETSTNGTITRESARIVGIPAPPHAYFCLRVWEQ